MFGTMSCNVPLTHHTFAESFDLLKLFTRAKYNGLSKKQRRLS